MPTIDKFNDNFGTAVGIVGPAGSGKTVLGMRLYPKTWVIVGDLNFKSGLDYLRKRGELGGVVGYDTISVDDAGQRVAPNLRYDRFWKCIDEATKKPEVDAVFVDGATQVTEAIIAKIVGATQENQVIIGSTKDSYSKWGQVGITWRGLVNQLRTSGKKLLMAIHESKNLDESDSIWKHELLIPGQTKDMLPNLMSDMLRTEVKESLGKHAWNVRLLPNARMEFLKSPSIPKNGDESVILQDELVKRMRTSK